MWRKQTWNRLQKNKGKYAKRSLNRTNNNGIKFKRKYKYYCEENFLNKMQNKLEKGKGNWSVKNFPAILRNFKMRQISTNEE